MNDFGLLFFALILVGIFVTVEYFIDIVPYEKRCQEIGGTLISDQTPQCWDKERGIRLFPDENR